MRFIAALVMAGGVIGTADLPQTRITKANLSCGIPPIPPVGCKVGACLCDSTGRNCQWTFACR